MSVNRKQKAAVMKACAGSKSGMISSCFACSTLSMSRKTPISKQHQRRVKYSGDQSISIVCEFCR